MRLLHHVFGLSLVLLAGISSYAQEPSEQSTRKPLETVIESARIASPDGSQIAFELGTLYVPENRAEGNSRLIGVGFARFRADAESNVPPLFLLPGGPGESYLVQLQRGGPRSALLRWILQLRGIGDVVILDQRGFSERGDILNYRYRRPSEPLDEPANLERSARAFTEMATAAVKEFESKQFDLRGYTVIECADDVNDLRKALGYDTITLIGGSFGSQWSFAVMRRHPDHVARALLSGVEPLDCGYDMPSHVLAAMQRIWQEAEEDERLKPYLPPGGITAAAQEVLRRLEREPVKVPINDVTITLGHEDFQRSPQLRTVAGPEFVLSLYHKHYDHWALMTYQARRSRPAAFPVIAALVDTSLGVTPRRLYLLRNDIATTVLGQWNFNNFLATADIWPSPDVGDDFRTELACQIPVVFVHGDWDTQTPVENTLQVAPYFPNGHVLLVERGGHGALGQVAQHLPETMKGLLTFLKTGNLEKLPTRVAVPAPKFKVPNFPVPKG